MLYTCGLLAALTGLGADLPRDPYIAGLESLYDSPAVLWELHEPVVCVLDTQHPETVHEKLAKAPPESYIGRKLQRIVRELSRARCLLLHYSETKRAHFASPQVKAVMLSARSRRINSEIDDELFAIIRELRAPMIGFCGGHQLIAQAYGGEIEIMRRLDPGEEDTNPKYYPGRLKEWGFLPVTILRRDPLFEGLPDEIIVREMHAWRITKLPSEFDRLASTGHCRVQVIKHRNRPLYGTQFHPEAYDDDHLHGRQLIANFLRLADLPLK